MKIIDAFPFFNEIDTLKIRLSLLYEKVNFFLICESNVTFSGQKKSYNFQDHKSEFAEWMDKIIYVNYEPDISNLDFSSKDTILNPSSAPWKIENGQRNYLSKFLTAYDPNDIVIVSDVDEIWNPAFADLIRRGGEISLEAARLEMKFHYYHLNCVGVGEKNSKWSHPFFAKVKIINSYPDLDRIRVYGQLSSIKNAGWHFSYLGGAKAISDKINAFSHQETNTPEINNLRHLERCINLGIDHLNREGHEWVFRPVDFYPEPLRKEMMKYPHLIKSSLI